MPSDLTTYTSAPALASDSQSTGAAARQNPPRYKYRIRFRKAGDLRLVSHHDLMHVVERMFRRADLRLATTQGFHPRPKMTFALSLALGVSGLNEVLEIETAEDLPAEEVLQRLARQCPPGLEFLAARSIVFNQSAAVRRAMYRIAIGDRIEPNAIAGFLERSECWVERVRPHPRRVNVRPFVSELCVNDGFLQMALWITPYGAARPEEVAIALGLKPCLDEGAVIERMDLELMDEAPPGSEPPPRIEGAIQEIKAEPRVREAAPKAIMDHPLSFET